MSFDTVLIANRGEIALRVIEACRELELRSIVAYSEADGDMPYLRLADRAICIGPAQPAKSYLNIAAIISAAELNGAGAIHPGYGFLAENPHFVEVCEDHRLTFIGPPSSVMKLLGDKMAARRAVADTGVPVLPGMPMPRESDDQLAAADSIGYPVLIKSVYGGGGRGMRWVDEPSEFLSKASAAAEEARVATESSALYLEKALENPRHIEVQILADGNGNVIHLGERECSIQRRHQKLIEETPAPNLPQETREAIWKAAVDASQAVGYRNAGTVEFVVAPDHSFYFIEMNARIQVEHSVSEVICGLNLIKEQIRVAQGKPLSHEQAQIPFRGHAIECRINAEDPDNGFMPCCGTVGIEELPGGNGIRFDSALHQGMEIKPHYDSLIGKLIAWGETRDEAIVRMGTSLERLRLSGIRTTTPLLMEILRHPAFRRGEVTTAFLEQHFPQKR
ncbi:acetyl-CoA carboxylase biotin carboxylase subunit [Candidatus Bipolaricaulota bacterium]|nr:acetyl-CoA carboxylase biotin carboxylase subunit [Candidatus Bipolaricaulota bacterium]